MRLAPDLSQASKFQIKAAKKGFGRNLVGFRIVWKPAPNGPDL
jgi:hypothetical protein